MKLAKYRKQDAVLWRLTGTDSTGAKQYRGTPEPIKCRWESKQKIVLDSKGTEVISTAEVMVGEVLTPGDLLWLGALADADTDYPLRNPGAKTIIAFEDIPQRKLSQEHLLMAYL